MKKFFNIFFVTLGVIFFLLIIAGTYFYITDPYGIRPIIESLAQPSSSTTRTSGAVDKHPLLSSEQEQVLQSFGIDPAKLPTQITAEQEACFVQALGSARVQEIKSGSTPTAGEMMKASPCWK